MQRLDPRHVELAQRVRFSSSLWALMVTTLLTVVLLSAAGNHQLDARHLHAIGLCNAAAYGLMHCLRRLRQAECERRDDDAALIAQLIYRSPARITDLDLAAYWVTFGVLAPVLAASG